MKASDARERAARVAAVNRAKRLAQENEEKKQAVAELEQKIEDAVGRGQFSIDVRVIRHASYYIESHFSSMGYRVVQMHDNEMRIEWPE
jgi:hypothetical protein